MIKKILQKDDPVLHKVCHPVTNFDQKLANLLDDMTATLKDAQGLGLAAPQIGILRRVCIVLNDQEEYLELVNPEIIDTQGEQEGLEGCLSLPGIWGVVKRPMTVTVKAMDRNGNVFTDTDSGLIGRCFVHECEHLDGILFVDRASKILTEEDLQRMEEEGEPEPGSEEE